MDIRDEKTTSRLAEVLKRTHPDEAGRVLKEYADKLTLPQGAFSEYVRGLFRQKGLRQQDVFLLADIPERYGYKLVSGEKTTQKRDVLLRIFLAAGFSIDETQRALKLAGLPELYPRRPRDAVMMIALNSNIRDPFDVDELLARHGMEPLSTCGTDEK